MKALTSLAASVFGPPFRGLAVFVWIFFILCFVFHPDSQIKRGHFVDSDDYLYMVQAVDWVQGQSWFDTVQHRINPPEGTAIHFSPLMNFAYGAPTAFFSHFVSMSDAATVTAILYPLIYFALLLIAARWTAEVFVGRKWAGVTSWIALFAMSLLFQFMPGRVDHHGLEALLGLAAFGCTARMMLQPEKLKYACGAALTLAFAMTIALEIMPVFLVIVAVTGLWATVMNRDAARAGFVFASTLFLASCAFLLATVPVNHLFETTDAFAFSIIYVALAGGIAACFGVAWLVQKISVIWTRVMIVAAAACVVGTVLAWRFLAGAGGPAGAVDPVFTKLVFRHASEAWPVLQKGPLRGPYTHSLFLPALALISQYVFGRRDDKRMLWPSTLLSALIASTYALALFYQQRTMPFADAFSIIALSVFLQNIWTISRRIPSRKEALALIFCGFLLAGPLTTVLLPALGGAYSPVGVALFPVQLTQNPCDQNDLINVLNANYGDHPHIIMNMMDQAPELLLRTPHSIVAAPYPQDVTGNKDSYRFFMTKDMAEAEAIARRHKADLVAMCVNYESIYNNDDNETGYGQIVKADPSRLVELLITGKEPDWLKPVDDMPVTSNLLLFEVLPGHPHEN